MTPSEPDRSLDAIAALGDPRRRALYRFVAGRDAAVGRDEAAAAVGVSRSAAAFHLDRMAHDGLLATEFRRLSGRRGPGAGRPSKLYRRAAGDIALSLPDRRYDLAGDLLAGAIVQSAARGQPVEDTLRRLARARGVEMAASVPEGGPEDAVQRLRDNGYEPQVVEGAIVLANCPFRALAARHTDLVCGMNVALLEGFAGALPRPRMTARPRPSEHACCVRLELEPQA